MAGGKPIASNPRLAALGILKAVIIDQASLAAVMPAVANADTSPSTHTALVKALVYGTLRHFESLHYRLSQYLAKPFRAKDRDVEIVLLLGLFQLIHLDKPARACVNETVELCRALRKDWAVKVVNGVLRSALRDEADSKASGVPVHEHLPPSARYELPEWLLQQLRQDWPDDWKLAAAESNIQAPMTLRVNALQDTVEGYLSRLSAAGMVAQPLSNVEYGIQLEQACPVDKLPGFNEGQVSVQDEAAQLCAGLFVAALVKRHEPDIHRPLRLLDACSAPGGKTCAAIEALLNLGYAVEMTALDISPNRLERVEATFERLGLTHIAATEPERLKLRTLAADAADLASWHTGEETFDGILVDAPCSGTGVIRRHPDIKQLRRPEDVAALVGQQTSLLDGLARCVGVKGLLVYATCSILRAENDQAVARLLSVWSDFTNIAPAELCVAFEPYAAFAKLPAFTSTDHGIQVFAAAGRHDGFFYSVIHRI
ncbi:MAG: 16S rRNA (cytosine(967)-C(5))-methyltransferase [unclassified Hahellaceae]|nr:16S rRNA (cytosine(967)-C(5))-methyltransferase [Hahellaceae bacterium]|tara:strand:+ start:11787 stop:13244 length:1458 start_codon:yes stop_codon:yes gene_type:complete